MAKKLNWALKGTNSSNSDVSISVSDSGTRIVFRNGCFKKINKNGLHFKYAVDGKRIYFKNTDKAEGYKVRVRSDNIQWLCMTRWLKGFGGKYDLEYDEIEKLYYIEIKERENGK